MFHRLTLALLAVFALADTLTGAHAAEAVHPQVRIVTADGNITIELYPERAPLTVAAFLKYVREGQYTQTLFHRVIPNFLIQGGGFAATNNKVKPAHDSVPNESGNGLLNRRGWVGLARTNEPHSGNCQFYINTADNPDLDPLPARWGYAVFGRVIDGMDVADHISTVPAGATGPFDKDAPLAPVIIEKVEIVDGAAAAAPAAAAPTQRPVVSPGSGALQPLN